MDLGAVGFARFHPGNRGATVNSWSHIVGVTLHFSGQLQDDLVVKRFRLIDKATRQHQASHCRTGRRTHT